MKATPTDLVRFTKAATCTAAVWCRERGVTGVVEEVQSSNLVINVGLYYNIYALQEHVEVIARASDAPIPDDQGI
jgi:hypothetical protein